MDIKMIVAENVRKRRRTRCDATTRCYPALRETSRVCVERLPHLGLSQEKLALSACDRTRQGISAKCVSQIENRHNTTLAVVQKIANALEVEPSLLFYSDALLRGALRHTRPSAKKRL